MKRLIGSMASMVSLATAGLCHAAPPCGGYEVEILPEIPCPGPLPDFSVQAEAINDAGMVTGHYQNQCTISGLPPFEGFTWTPETGIVTIPRPPGVITLQAYDISDSGLVVGRHGTTSPGLGYLGFIYDGRRLTSLGTLPGGTSSQANAVNSAGAVVGWWGNALTGIPTSSDAFIHRDGVMEGLGDVLGTPRSAALDIAENDLVTGWMGSSFGANDVRAFVFDDGVVTTLPPVPGGLTSMGIAISNDGWVAGHGLVEVAPGDFVLRPFVWDGKRMIPINYLPGATSSRVTGMNNDHQVIGYVAAGALAEGQTGAFLWSDGVTYDIGDFIRRDDYVLTQPNGINDHGDMAMTGAFDGRGVAAVVRPVAQRFADLNCDGAVDLADVQLLIAAWGACEDSRCPADLDDNGIVNGFDLAHLLASWG